MKRLVLAICGLWILIEMAAAIAGAPHERWNGIRLARSLALHRGVPIYPAESAPGPVIGTLHLPLSHLAYQPALIFQTPGAAIAAGSALSILFVTAPVAWLLLTGARKSWLAFLALMSVYLQRFTIAFTMTSIHTDAAAIGLALLAAGLIYRARFWVLAGAAAALCVAAKQTMAAIPVALFLWVAFTGDHKSLAKFALGLAAGTAASLAIALAVAGSPDALIFNVITLAGHRPPKAGWPEVLGAGLRWLRWEGLTAAACITLALVMWWRRAERGKPLAQNRWAVFAAAAAAQTPAALKAWLTVGGDVNHLGALLVLLWMAAVLALVEMDDAQLAKAMLAVLFVLNLAPAAPAILYSRCRQWGTGESDQAFRYLQEGHRGIWFPWHPLAHAMAEGRFYHVDFPLKDRELAGYPISAGQFRSGLPDGLEWIALPAGGQPDSQGLANLVSDYEKVDQPALATWDMLRKR